MFEKILFPVRKEPFFYAGQETGKSLIIREDSNELISVVSNDYLLIPNRLIIDEMLKSQSEILNFQKSSIYSNGSSFKVELGLKYDNIEVQPGDFVGAILSLENSYDGSKSLRLSLNAERLVCSNGMKTNQLLYSSSTRHIGDKTPEDVVREMITFFDEGVETFGSAANKLVSMTKKKLDEKIKKKFLSMFKDHPNYVMELIAEEILKEKPSTLWDLYNCFTYTMTHKIDRSKQSLLSMEEQISEKILSLV